MFSTAVIVPTWHYFANPFKLQPLWELYSATIIDQRLSDQDVKVSVIDLRQAREKEGSLVIDNLPAYVPENDVYLYWIAKTADYLEILEIVKKIRNTHPKAKHVAGGTHVDNFPDECKKNFDSVIVGPGEEAFIKVIKDMQNNSLKQVYKSDYKDVKYEDYPIANREFLSESSIVNTDLFDKYGKIKGTSAMFSRGCNFRCSYCVYNVPNFIQMRKPETVEKEINYLRETYNLRGINLRDEICIPLNQKIAIPHLEAIGRCDVIWRGQTKVGVKREIMELARKTGLVELAVGVESVSQQVLDIIHKGQKLEQVKEFFKICCDLDIKTKMCLILGLPGEPQDIVERTYDFIDETKPDYVNVSGLCPVPGSHMFNNQDYYGFKYIDDDWSKHAHLMFRYSDEEDFGLPFEYKETNKWGKTFSRMEIMENIRDIQHYLQENDMCY